MDIIIDTNIIFSTLTYSRKTQHILIKLYRGGYNLHAPKELIAELEKHVDKIEKYSPLPRDLLREIITRVLPHILNLHNIDDIPDEIKRKAKKLAEDADPTDWPFIALAMHLNAPLWTGDKKLVRLAVRAGFKHYKAVDTRGVEMLLEGKQWKEIEEHLKKEYG